MCKFEPGCGLVLVSVTNLRFALGTSFLFESLKLYHTRSFL